MKDKRREEEREGEVVKEVNGGEDERREGEEGDEEEELKLLLSEARERNLPTHKKNYNSSCLPGLIESHTRLICSYVLLCKAQV